MGGASVDLLFAATHAWESLADDVDFIGREARTPAVEHYLPCSQAARLAGTRLLALSQAEPLLAVQGLEEEIFA